MIVEASGFVLRRNWFPVLGAFVLAVLGALFVWGSSYTTAPFGYFAIFFGLTFGAVFLIRNAFPRAKPTRFSAAPTGIAIEGHGEVWSEDILEAKLVPRHGRDAVVELALRGRKTLLLRTALRDAQALVSVLGARRSRFRLVVPFRRRFLAVFALLASVSLLLAAIGDVGRWLGVLPGCVFYACLLGWLIGYVRGRLVVGADGYTKRWLFWQRFVPFRDVAAVTARPRLLNRSVQDTLVELASGRKVRLCTVEAPNTEEERGGEGRAMLGHLQEAFAQWARLRDGSVNIPSLVERGSRSAREWLSGLDALVRGGGSRYRVAAVSADMLADLANDPSASIESRVGAAAALVRMGDDAQRTRVRVSAAACAEPELRETLLALAEAHDDVAAEAALASLRR